MRLLHIYVDPFTEVNDMKKSSGGCNIFQKLSNRRLVMSNFWNKWRKKVWNNWAADFFGNKNWHIEKSSRKSYPLERKTWKHFASCDKIYIWVNNLEYIFCVSYSSWFFHSILSEEKSSEKNFPVLNKIYWAWSFEFKKVNSKFFASKSHSKIE